MAEETSKNKVLKAGAGYVIGNYLLKGITFLSAPIFTRLLSTDDFGYVSTYISYESVLYILIGMALHSSINNAKYKYKEKFEEYVSSIILLTIISSAVWLLLANIFFPFYHEQLDMSRTIVNILILHCFGSAIIAFFNGYVSLSYRAQSFVKISSLNAISNLVLSVLLVLTIFSNNRYLGRVWGIAVPVICIGAGITIYFFKQAKPVVRKEYFRFGLNYSLPMIPHGISQVILSSFDRIMIKSMVGASEAGIYSFAYTIYSIFQVMQISLTNVWKPWFYEQMEAKDYKKIRNISTKYAFGMAILTLMLLLVSPEIIKILGDVAYWDSTVCVVPIVIGGYYAFLYTMPVFVEYFYEKTKYIALGSICAAVLNIILNYLFIPKFGYVAAAYTTLATYFFNFVFHFLLAKRFHGASLFSTKALFGISAGIMVIGLGVVLLEKLLLIRWFLELITFVVGVIWVEKNFGVKEKLLEKLNKGKKG